MFKKKKNNSTHNDLETEVLIKEIVRNFDEIKERTTMLDDIVVENKIKNLVLDLIKYEKDNNISDADISIYTSIDTFINNKSVAISIYYSNEFYKEFELTFNKKIDFDKHCFENKLNNIYCDEYINSIDNKFELKIIKKKKNGRI